MSKSSSFKVDNSAINEQMINQFKLSMDPNAIPDLHSLMEKIENMLSFMETDEMRRLEEENLDEFETLVYGRYNAEVPMKIISLMVDENRYENLEQLLDMFDVLMDVKTGKKNIQEEAEKFSEKQNEKYVYPKFGGKEEFQKVIAEGEKKAKIAKRRHKNKK